MFHEGDLFSERFEFQKKYIPQALYKLYVN